MRLSAVRSLLMLSSVISLCACLPKADQPPPALVAAVPQVDAPIELLIAPNELPEVRQVRKQLPRERSGKDIAKGLPAILEARQEALVASAPDGFVNSTQYFAYEPGALFELHAAAGFISTIALQPGERLVKYVAGDTARWIFNDVTAGDRTRIFVKPTRPDLSTNIIVITDRRSYFIEAKSHDGNVYNSVVAWTYPLDELAEQVSAVAAVNARREETIATGIAIDQLDFNYDISGAYPSWRPLRAFDDGKKVYIEFPDDLGTTEAPPLFLTDSTGTGQLVNYRVKKNHYIIDRLFDQAVLDLDGTTVFIDKQGTSRSSFSGARSVSSSSSSDLPRPCRSCRGRDDDYDDDKDDRW